MKNMIIVAILLFGSHFAKTQISDLHEKSNRSDAFTIFNSDTSDGGGGNNNISGLSSFTIFHDNNYDGGDGGGTNNNITGPSTFTMTHYDTTDGGGSRNFYNKTISISVYYVFDEGEKGNGRSVGNSSGGHVGGIS